MNEKDFSQKAFEDALKATIGVIEKPTSEEEYQSFKRLIVENSDAIMDAARIKVEMEDKVKSATSQPLSLSTDRRMPLPP